MGRDGREGEEKIAGENRETRVERRGKVDPEERFKRLRVNI